MNEATYRFAVVDELPAIRLAVRTVIEREPEWSMTHEAGRPSDVMRLFASDASRPDVVIFGLLYTGECGLEFASILKSRYPAIRSIMFSLRTDAHYARRCLRAGARAYVCKADPIAALIEAAHTVIAGRTYVSPMVAQEIARGVAASPTASGAATIDDLSDREVEVFELIGRGMSTRDIASYLHRSIKTIETYRYRIRKKLGIESATELAQVAGRHVEGANPLGRSPEM